jgi:hypothetical protein
MSDQSTIFKIMWNGIVNIRDEYPDDEDRVWAAMAAVDAAGYVIVPREPTPAMVEAGEREFRASDRACCMEPAEECWRAMIVAAKEIK